LVEGNKDYHQVTEDIVRPIEAPPSRLWWIGFLISVALLLFGVYSVYREVVYGVGQWNLNKTVGWGWDITNFVWWVGIGHAGTLISAILLLFRQGWRTGVNRAAEAMTIFAVMCAGQFPIDRVQALEGTGFDPDTYVYGQCKATVEAVKGKVPVYMGIGVDAPRSDERQARCTPDIVKRSVLATYRAGGKGVVFSPNYAGMDLANLDGAAEALRELGLHS